jgi:fumarate reductase subunit C
MGDQMSGSAVRPDKSKLYYPKMSRTWWLTKRAYVLFMLRELSSVFIAIFLVVFLAQIFQLTKGPDAYAAFAQKLSSPGWILFHGVALLFALYHSLTWFQSTAVIMPLNLGERAVPRSVVFALILGAWIAASAVILILFLAFRG